MIFYSTGHNSPEVSLRDAVRSGFAPDGGLYMPSAIQPLPAPFFRNIAGMSPVDIAYVVANRFLSDDFEPETVREIVNEALSFPLPLVEIDGNRICSLELFHGPTMSVKDIGARFMASLMDKMRSHDPEPLHILVATSGDAGSAVVSAFHHLPNVHVTVLYPKGRLTYMQKRQFTDFGPGITAVEVRGSFDDCRALTKAAALDETLSGVRVITANSINIARFMAQTFHFFIAYAGMVAAGADPDRIVVSVPSGNLGNLAAGIMACRMGLPLKRILAATNANDCFPRLLATGQIEARPPVRTLANAMDSSYPTNLPRITDAFESLEMLQKSVTAEMVSDEEITQAIRELNSSRSYVIDPHTACAYTVLRRNLEDGDHGAFLATADPAKCPEAMSAALGKEPPSRHDTTHHGAHHNVPITSPPIYQSIKYIIQTVYDKQTNS